MQYQDRSILEYWIVDPQQETVLVLELTETGYTEFKTFTGTEPMRSLQFGELTLTPTQLFAVGA